MAGCCWRPIAHQRPLSADRRAPSTSATGAIPLNDQPDNALPYTGEGRNETIYLVGWGTEHERLFPATDAKQAVAYRNDIDKKLRIDPVPASQLPTGAVVELLAR